MTTQKQRDTSAIARKTSQTKRAERAERAVKLWKEHAPDMTIERIANAIGVDPRTVYRYLKNAGIQLPPQKPPVRKIDPAKVRQAHELYKKLGTKAKVAEVMNCAPSMVAIYLNRDIETSE